jgi:hypothetical protein
MTRKTKHNEDGHNTTTTNYRGNEIIWCADCGYFNTYKSIHIISDTFDGCKQLIDMSEGKLAHISNNEDETICGFIRPKDKADESEPTN